MTQNDQTQTIVIWDTEYWTDKGAMQRRWGGLHDSPPVLCQIGGYKVRLNKTLDMVAEINQLVWPQVQGRTVALTDFFHELTGLSAQQFEETAVDAVTGIKMLHDFIGDDLCFSYGRDVFSTVLPTCFANDIDVPLHYNQCKDYRHLLVKAGYAEAEVVALTSGKVADFLSLEVPHTRAVHDAQYDAMSLLVSLRHLLETGKLTLQQIIK